MKVQDIDPEKIKEIALAAAATFDTAAEATRQFGKVLHQLGWSIQEAVKSWEEAGKEE